VGALALCYQPAPCPSWSQAPLAVLFDNFYASASADRQEA